MAEWIKWHAQQTKENDFFVKENGKSFYTKITLDFIKNKFEGERVEVYNCNWKPENFSTDPYYYIFTKNETYEFYAQATTEEPNHFTFALRGIKLNGDWVEKHYKNGANFIRWHDCGTIHAITNKGVARRRTSGEWVLMDGVNERVANGPPEFLFGLVKQLNHKKHNGFYDNVIALSVVDGLRNRFI